MPGQTEGPKDVRTEGWKDRRTDRPYFIGPYWLPPGVQLKSDYAVRSNCDKFYSPILNEKILKNRNIHLYYKRNKYNVSMDPQY